MRRRKLGANTKTLCCQISPECYSELSQFAGEFALGWAIEELVKTHKELRTAISALQVEACERQTSA
jgi:hypothetical protein